MRILLIFLLLTGCTTTTEQSAEARGCFICVEMKGKIKTTHDKKPLEKDNAQ